MSKKDYIAIAAILNREYQIGFKDNDPEVTGVIIRIANKFCILFEQDNQLFSADTFMEAVIKEQP